jgi:alpha-glucosidase
MLELYREGLRIRRAELQHGHLAWLDADPGVLAFERGGRFACVVNLSSAPAALPAHETVLLASEPLEEGHVGPDAAVWLRRAT